VNLCLFEPKTIGETMKNKNGHVITESSTFAKPSQDAKLV
jgi:hypothetical protein